MCFKSSTLSHSPNSTKEFLKCMQTWLFWDYLIQSWPSQTCWPFSSLRQQSKNKYYNIPLLIKREWWEYSLEFFPSNLSALSCTRKLWSALEVVEYAFFGQVWFNGEGDFWTKSVEILVYPSPTGYMLTSFGFSWWNYGIFYRFSQRFVMFPKSWTSTG